MSDLLTWDNLASLASLTALEIVLGIDNVVFISILTDRLPPEQQGRARRLGLALALITRIGLLFAISWLVTLTAPLFSVLGNELSGRDLILIGGGLFLVFKATKEVYEKLEVPGHAGTIPRRASYASVISMIVALDIVFSLDSVITAVGMSNEFAIMATAVIVAVAVMLVFVNPISAFVNRHPSMKVLALSFLLLIGVTLIVEGTGGHFERGYVYFAMAFSLTVELLNMGVRKKQQVVQLAKPFDEEPRDSK
jgi:predicted tellurium resistance membrane protein TerC